MFLIDAIKPKRRKEIKNFFLRDYCLGLGEASVQNKNSFFPFRVMFSGGNKYFIQKK